MKFSNRKRRALFVLALALLVGAIAANRLLPGCAPSPGSQSAQAELPVLGKVPDFTLLERSGKNVTLSDLAGRPWVADFIFTHCQSFCPILSARMARLETVLRETNGDVRLVSFTVDPERDTVAVLREYADRHGADPDRWLFLTGSWDDLRQLIVGGFGLAVERPPSGGAAGGGGLITHSQRFVLVDSQARIRGYYDAFNEDPLPAILRDIDALEKAP